MSAGWREDVSRRLYEPAVVRRRRRRQLAVAALEELPPGFRLTGKQGRDRGPGGRSPAVAGDR